MNKKGFTLIELLVIIAIFGILGAILVPKISEYIVKKEGTTTEKKEDFKSMVEKKMVSVPTQQIIECVEGKQTIKIQGEVFYLGRIKNTWGDLEAINCE
jgi:prepilin-type N-terminal cleavage/methylation domain-containing protein